MSLTAIECKGVCNVMKHLSIHGATPGQMVQVEEAVNKASATVPWAQILFTIMGDLLGVFMGQPLDIAKIIADILALINPPAPVPPAA